MNPALEVAGLILVDFPGDVPDLSTELAGRFPCRD